MKSKEIVGGKVEEREERKGRKEERGREERQKWGWDERRQTENLEFYPNFIVLNIC